MTCSLSCMHPDVDHREMTYVSGARAMPNQASKTPPHAGRLAPCRLLRPSTSSCGRPTSLPSAGRRNCGQAQRLFHQSGSCPRRPHLPLAGVRWADDAQEKSRFGSEQKPFPIDVLATLLLVRSSWQLQFSWFSRLPTSGEAETTSRASLGCCHGASGSENVVRVIRRAQQRKKGKDKAEEGCAVHAFGKKTSKRNLNSAL